MPLFYNPKFPAILCERRVPDKRFVEGSDDPVRSGSCPLLEVTAFDGDAFFVQVLAGAAGQGFRTRERPYNGLLYTRINTEYDMAVYRKSVR